MEDRLKIYIDRLRNGQVEEIEETVKPDFLGVQERDLTFLDSVEVVGKAYIAGDRLILNFNVETVAHLPCKVCNTPTAVDIRVRDMYHGEPVEDIKTAIFHYGELLREVVLLQVPKYTECHDGQCPEREKITEYLKKNGSEVDEYQPFKKLDIEKHLGE